MFGPHSLRSGWISTGTAEGRREEAMMRHSRHLSISVFRVRAAREQVGLASGFGPAVSAAMAALCAVSRGRGRRAQEVGAWGA
jgi:hypothetical protein